MFWKPVFQQGYTPHIISQMGKDYYYSYKYTPCPHSHSLGQGSNQCGLRKEASHAKPINSHLSPASKTPFTETKQNIMSAAKSRTPQGRSHIFCADISHTSAVGKELQLLLTATSCNSSFCSQWPETLKSLEMPAIALPACFLTSGSTCTAIPPWKQQTTMLLSAPRNTLTSSTLREKEEGRAKSIGYGEAQVLEEDSTTDGKGARKDYPMWRQERIRSSSLHCSILPLLDCAGSFTWQRPCR